MKNETKKWRETARAVVKHHFGSSPSRIEYKASGLTNFVFSVKNKEGSFIVRLSPDAEKINHFFKEQWAQTAAKKAGVPVAEILEVGNWENGEPFMIVSEIKGVEATSHPERLKIINEMGRIAALINSISTSGFGSTFDWSSNQLSRKETFAEYLENDLQTEEKLQTLEKHRMISAEQTKRLKKIFADAAKTKRKPKLTHGDLRLKNIIVDESGAVKAVLDWENCTSNAAPEWELSIALHDLWIDEKQEFLKGYGLPEKKFREITPLIKAFNIVNYAATIEQLAEKKDKDSLEQYRTRLGGFFDLYSFGDK